MVPGPVITFPIPPDTSQAQWRFLLCVAAMRARYGTVQACAKAWGVTKQAVYGALRQHNISAPLEQRFSDLTGYPRDVLFPKKERAA